MVCPAEIPNSFNMNMVTMSQNNVHIPRTKGSGWHPTSQVLRVIVGLGEVSFQGFHSTMVISKGEMVRLKEER